MDHSSKVELEGDRSDLYALYCGLETPTGPASVGEFMAIEIPNHPQHRIAKNSVGSAALLLSIANGSSAKPAPIALQNLSVQHGVECLIRSPRGEESRQVFTVVQTVGNDTELNRYFVSMAGVLIGSLGSSPTAMDLSRILNTLVALFRGLDRPPRKTTQGFWGELFLIARSPVPEFLLAAWHTDPTDKYDFSSGYFRLEVKSGAGNRRHYFSHEQTHPPNSINVAIASLFVERDAGGVTLQSLLDNVRTAVAGSPKLAVHLESVVVQTLGDSLPGALNIAFDKEVAEESIRYYNMGAVPKLEDPLPSGVFDVRYRADLAGVPEASVSAFPELFARALRLPTDVTGTHI